MRLVDDGEFLAGLLGELDGSLDFFWMMGIICVEIIGELFETTGGARELV